MEKIKKWMPDKNSLYYAAFIIWFSCSMLFGRSTLRDLPGIQAAFWLKKVCYPICGMLILLVMFLSGFFDRPDRKKVREYLPAVLLAVLFGLSWMISGWGTYFMQLMFLISAKEIDLRKLPRITLYVQLIVVALIISLSLTGVIENISYVYYRMNSIPVYRQALGVVHPHALGAQVVQFGIVWLWIRWERWKWYDNAVYALAAYSIFMVSNSVTSTLLIVLIPCIYFLYRLLLKRKHAGVLEGIMKACVPAVPILIMPLAYLCTETNEKLAVFDRIISWRLIMANRFLLEYPASLLGRRIPSDAGTDLLYIDILVKYGGIILAVLVIGMYLLMKYAISKKMYPLVLSVFIYTFYGITEHYPYLLMYNFTLVYLVNVIYGGKDGTEKGIGEKGGRQPA